MKTALSTRRARFYSLIRQASDQPTNWLESVYNNPNKHTTALVQAAILRVLMTRYNQGHLVYVVRRASAKAIVSAKAAA